ncbi:MAG TPA: hypothetical protein VFE25_15470 [Opitutaceae bacterium]|jgi:hypothetical protein|nr:hypothetical protein [Opitutaceae bacterium]
MDDDSPSPEPKGRPSQIPSWVSLGFALGALFVMALPRRSEPEVQAAPTPVPELRATAPVRVSTIEAVFSDWGRFAQWNGPTTQVGLWNTETKSYSDFFEVIRMGEALYFRSIPSLTAPVAKLELPQACPLEFAEAGRADPQAEERRDIGAISKGIRDSFGPTELPKTAPSN